MNLFYSRKNKSVVALFFGLLLSIANVGFAYAENMTEKNGHEQQVTDNKEKQKNNKRALPKTINLQDGLLRIYRSNLLKKTYRYVIYPETSIDNHQEGDVILKLTVNRGGEIKKLKFHSKSEFIELNRAASKAVKKAKPFPPVPSRLEGETFEILMPIKFRLAS